MRKYTYDYDYDYDYDCARHNLVCLVPIAGVFKFKEVIAPQRAYYALIKYMDW